LIWLLLASYAAGALAPAAGLRLRSVQLTRSFSLPMVMLGFLLVVAGLGARLDELKHLLRQPLLLVAGLLTNLFYPLLFTAVASALLLGWHNNDEAQSILVGLAMIGTMPIAGSSTAWAQNADANLALSLGLVWGSTLLSPLTTPLGLHLVGLFARGDYSEDLHELARGSAVSFVLLAVVAPSLLGLLGRRLVGGTRLQRVMPALKLLNLVDLLVLNYSNAAVGLPQLVKTPDPDFILLTIVVCTLLCAGAFAAGWWLPRLVGGDRADRLALTFGLGMTNNGTGLVLAAAALSDHPRVLVPIIFYNLVQQMAAGIMNALATSERPAGSSLLENRVDRSFHHR
jgi:BASS family bile acid:Na+ symporter